MEFETQKPKRRAPAAIAATVLTLCCLTGAAMLRAKAAKAPPPPPPSKMEPVDAAKLDAAVAHLQQIQQLAQAQSAPHLAVASEIAERYKFALADLGNTVGVDFRTGEIKRAEPKQEPAKK